MFKVNNNDTRMTPTPCSSVSNVSFGHVVAGWGRNAIFGLEYQTRYLGQIRFLHGIVHYGGGYVSIFRKC